MRNFVRDAVRIAPNAYPFPHTRSFEERLGIIGIALTLLLAMCQSLWAHEFKAGDIEIVHPYARAMLPGAEVGGGYLTIVNSGDTDRLVSATAERAGSAQLHEMKMDDGIMVMRELKDGIAVPAHATIELKPDGYHVIFMNVADPFRLGEEIRATLVFEKAGPVDLEFAVGPPAGNGSTVSHDAHAKGHGDHLSGHAMTAMTGDPQQDIPARMKAIFETPDKPLSVKPVVVQGDWAIASWTQDWRGGRALLKKKDDGWSINLCSGDGLKRAEALKTMGLSQSDAEAIAAKLAEAEEQLPPQTRALFASFEGTVMVEGNDANAQDKHGEHKLVLLAQRLLREPRLLLLDEATSALDIRHQMQVFERLRGYVERTGALVVIAIHDLNLAARHTDTILLLDRGRAAGIGPFASVIREETLRSVYGIEAEILVSHSGHPVILPIGAHGG